MILNKNKTIKKLKKHFNLNHSEYAVKLNAKLLDEAYAFSVGVTTCLKTVIEEPVKEEEVSKLVFDETVEYIKKKIDGVQP